MRLFFGEEMKRRSLIIVILVVVIGLIVYLNQYRTAARQLLALSGTTMGTSYHIKLAPTQGEKIDLAVLKREIDSRLAGIDNKMSTYKENSEISRFNRHSSNNWMAISAETLGGCQ